MGTFSSNIKKVFGHYDYNHGGSSQPLTANGWVQLLNDGTGVQTNDSQKPTGDGHRWNVATGQFDFTGLNIGDLVEVQFEVQYTTTVSNTQIDARMNLAIGDPINYTKPIRGSINYKNSGLQEPLRSSLKITMDNLQTINNPGQVEVKCENDMSVVVTGWKIFVNKRSL